jgi:hypothetical protein
LTSAVGETWRRAVFATRICGRLGRDGAAG